MNILYLNHYAGSPEMGMEFRPYYLAREWNRAGHNVTIVAGDFSHLRIQNPDVTKDFQEETIDGVRYCWIRTGAYEGNGAKRAFSMFRFVWKLMLHARSIAKDWNPDVVIASSTYPLDTFAAQRIRRFSSAKVIHEVHDMWPITLIELGGMKKTHPFVVLMQLGENSFCRHSDYVVSLLCEAKDYFVRHGMRPDKFKAIMNGVVREEWTDPEPLNDLHAHTIRNLHDEGKFVICFFGSITRSYAIDYLCDAVMGMQDTPVAFVIVGEGNQKEELMKKTKDCEDIVFLPRISKKEIPSLLELVDCCYVGALRNDMFRFGICMNKLFDSMMSGKPILYAAEAPNNFVQDYHCGISVEAENSAALEKGIRELLDMTPAERERLGRNGRKAVCEHFTYEKIAEEFETLF